MSRMLEITQYLRPDGRKFKQYAEIPDEEIWKMSQEIVQKGFRFEAEVLKTDQVSLTIYDPELDLDVAIRITDNGPGVITELESMIKRFYLNRF